ncbi:helix-turn-helix domain-containing protein [Aneurinibacillus aneurinilyticus]|uniref:helix-turn-helix domain-containing protein n=1 Tax=Aneurinibacillus aneurinilyticus TaxID=1391 RepID=UPI000FA5D137|nr:helix-turn-helix domain-containing protein [Aneurinibacillus aneurinilyticus]MED0672677.1 helix-turn-helix domain-containing protein [Aneurinibacillus aneurinilyticus]
MNRLLTIEETCDILAIPIQTGYAMAREKILPTVRIGRLVRIDPDKLKEWIDQGGKSYAGGWKKEIG